MSIPFHGLKPYVIRRTHQSVRLKFYDVAYTVSVNVRNRNTNLLNNVIGTGTTDFASMNVTGIKMPSLVLGHVDETEHYERK